MGETVATTPYRSTDRRVVPATRRHESALAEVRLLVEGLECVVVDELDHGPRTTIVEVESDDGRRAVTVVRTRANPLARRSGHHDLGPDSLASALVDPEGPEGYASNLLLRALRDAPLVLSESVLDEVRELGTPIPTLDLYSPSRPAPGGRVLSRASWLLSGTAPVLALAGPGDGATLAALRLIETLVESAPDGVPLAWALRRAEALA